MTSDEARELFSAAYDAQLDPVEQQTFDQLLDTNTELAEEYAAFCTTLAAVHGNVPVPPDLLKGVQKRLRNASAGRYYADRFAERSGVGRFQPWVMLVALTVLLSLAWLGMRLLHAVQIGP